MRSHPNKAVDVAFHKKQPGSERITDLRPCLVNRMLCAITYAAAGWAVLADEV